MTSSPRRLLLLAGLLLLLAAAAAGLWRLRRPTAVASPAAAAHAPAISATVAASDHNAAPALDKTTNVQRVTIPKRSNFVAACSPFSLPAVLLHRLIAVAKPVFNLGRIRAGNTLTLVRAAGGEIKALSYQIDDNHLLWLRAQPVEAAAPPAASTPATAANEASTAEQWTASIQTLPFQTRVVGVSGMVSSSLFQAVEDAGENDQLAVDIANIFAWDLDFYTDTRQGDVFRVLVEKKYLNGKFSHYGQIIAAEYVNDGQVYDAVRFHDRFGELAYYRPNGQPLKRAFLRSPLRFAARITSGFSYHRFHPILKVYRPHLGIDFAAPIGTPVQTIGSGVVIYAARKGEDGNMVRIRHANGYQTLYMHLSRILVRVGQSVHQGQTIGLVGMTGLATGPHLDFRIEQRGRFENFEVVRKTLPPAAPVSAKLMPQFKQIIAHIMPMLANLQPAAAPNTAVAVSTPAP